MLGYRILIASVLAMATAAVTIGTAAAYTVRPGDSLSRISSRTGVPVSKIAADNHIGNPNRIYVGEHLTIRSGAPDPAAVAASGQPARTYVVKRGDSLWKIARQAAVSISQIASLNNISTTSVLRVGQTLLLTPPAPAPIALAPATAVRGQAARQILVAAAHEVHMNPAFILAVPRWARARTSWGCRRCRRLRGRAWSPAPSPPTSGTPRPNRARPALPRRAA